MGASPRFTWVVSGLALAGSERVVEVGCGHGIAASLLIDALAAAGGTGTYLGIDRSVEAVGAVVEAIRRLDPPDGPVTAVHLTAR